MLERLGSRPFSIIMTLMCPERVDTECRHECKYIVQVMVSINIQYRPKGLTQSVGIRATPWKRVQRNTFDEERAENPQTNQRRRLGERLEG